MKTITMLCALAFAFSACIGLYNFAITASRMGMRLGTPFYIGQGAWLLAQCSLVAFFFTLYSRQNN